MIFFSDSRLSSHSLLNTSGDRQNGDNSPTEQKQADVRTESPLKNIPMLSIQSKMNSKIYKCIENILWVIVLLNLTLSHPEALGGKGLVGSGSILSGLVDKLWTTGKIRFLNRAKTFKFNIFLSLSFSPLLLSLSLPSFSLSPPLSPSFSLSPPSLSPPSFSLSPPLSPLLLSLPPSLEEIFAYNLPNNVLVFLSLIYR